MFSSDFCGKHGRIGRNHEGFSIVRRMSVDGNYISLKKIDGRQQFYLPLLQEQVVIQENFRRISTG